MALELFPLKFSPLPNADFGVALAPPFPDWFICGDSVKILRQQSQKKAQRVVATKHTLNSFIGHLYIGIEDVRIESDIYEGVTHEFPSKYIPFESHLLLANTNCFMLFPFSYQGST